MAENMFKKDSIRLFSGRYLNLVDPDPADIFLGDIAIGLARECRWGNHCKKFYSVAEHSIECMLHAELEDPENVFFAFECLMHDAHEAYLGDIPTPLKLLMPEYEVVATKVQQAINIRFGITDNHKEQVKKIDARVLNEEWKSKMLHGLGLQIDERTRVDLFTHHAVRLCKHPIPL